MLSILSKIRGGAAAFIRAMVVGGGVLVLAACTQGPSMPGVNAPMSAGNPADGYVLESGNRVRVTVFGEANMSGDFLIDSSGAISMPLIGNIPASGTTVPGLTQRIAAQMQKENILREPRISIEILSFRPFYVLGEVRQPGEFPYSTGMTVLSAIARAGGYDYRARQGEVVLVRMENGQQKDYRATERTPILPGDIVRVLERSF
jgi:polysaccharide export outer membrane protein